MTLFNGVVQLIGVIGLTAITMVSLTVVLIRAREAGGISRRVQMLVGVMVGLLAAGVASVMTIDAIPDRFEWVGVLGVIAAVIGFALIAWRVGRS